MLKKFGFADDCGAAELLSDASAKEKMLRRAEEAHEALFDTKKFW